ncbi:pilus assembly FimT family protein [Vibrio maritimus]|uniref:pilus assembly FimT family protein n=1 Tax=Vibrio maritimus TaxID=990268 RepID=UPI004067ECA7
MVRGFTLLELIIAIVVSGIILMAMVPAFTNTAKSKKVERAVLELYGIIVHTQAESILRNEPLWLHFEGLPEGASNGDWSAVVANSESLTGTDTNRLFTLSGAPFDGITLQVNFNGEQLKIDHITGAARAAGNITIKPYPQSEGFAKIVTDANSGRVRACQHSAEFGLGVC